MHSVRTTVLMSWLIATEKDAAAARVLLGWISAAYKRVTTPQLAAKLKAKNSIMTITAHLPPSVVLTLSAAYNEPMTSKEVATQAPPATKMVRRPRRST